MSEKQITFREYLTEVYQELHEDELEDWILELEPSDLIDYANNWGETLTKNK